MELVSALASLSTVWDKLKAFVGKRRSANPSSPQTAASESHVEQRSAGQGNISANAGRDLNVSGNVINIFANDSEQNVRACLENASSESLDRVDKEFRYHWLDSSRSATADRARKQFGALLDKESVAPGSVSPRTMRLLSEMSSREAKEFLAYCNQAATGVLSATSDEGTKKRLANVLLHRSGNEGFLERIGLLSEMPTPDGKVDSDYVLDQGALQKMPKIGASEFRFNFRVSYFRNNARVLSTDRIPAPKWLFTDEGQQLFETIDRIEIPDYWVHVIDSLTARGYTVVPSSSEGDKK